MGLVKTRVYRK